MIHARSTVEYARGVFRIGSGRFGTLRHLTLLPSTSPAGESPDGNVQLWGNGAIDVSDNVIDANLQCKGNAPAPTGGNNQVSGDAEDQCRALAE